MIRKTWMLSGLLFALACGCWAQTEEAQAPSPPAPAPAALSPEAERVLLTVAQVQEGATRIDPWKAGNTYGMRYTATPPRAADKAEALRLRQEMKDRVDARMVTLRDWADLDQSGSVTNSEAQALAWLFQFGRMVTFAMEQERTDEAAKIAKALQRPMDVLKKEYQTYIEHQARLGNEFGPPVRLKWPGDTTTQ
ncbi:MAG TPA: hypothetical protein VMW27_06385 [Thermoanaerobaculia bacterium]|nr:hypothetical protein [Thermoanaerobaculia bacterium]